MNKDYYDALTELFNLSNTQSLSKDYNMSQAQALNQVSQRRFVIASIDASGAFSMSASPVVHENEKKYPCASRSGYKQ